MIPVSEPTIGSQEWTNLQDCLLSNRLGSGHFIQEFEMVWSAHCARKFGVAVSNGTMALELAIQALSIPVQSEIIIPSFTIASCALAAIRCGLTPVFVDVEPDTWCLDPELVEAAITPLTRAIMPVHIYGHPANMIKISDIAWNHGLIIVEDAAQAHGATVRIGEIWRPCGSFGEVSCFSFYSNKIVSTGEGGMVLTNEEQVAQKLVSLRNLCFGDGSQRFVYTDFGHNARMTNMQAAIGVAQVQRLARTVERKRQIARSYRQALNDHRIQHPTEAIYAKNVYWMYGILIKDHQRIVKSLADKGIETRPFFTGLHSQAIEFGRISGSCPITERLASDGFYLPSSPSLTEGQISLISRTILEAL